MSNVSVNVDTSDIKNLNKTYTSSSPSVSSSPNINNTATDSSNSNNSTNSSTNLFYKCSEISIDKLVENIQEQLSKTYITTLPPVKTDKNTTIQSTTSDCCDATWRGLLHIDSLTRELEVLKNNPIYSAHLSMSCAKHRSQIPGNPSDWSLIVTLNSIFKSIPVIEPSLF